MLEVRVRNIWIFSVSLQISETRQKYRIIWKRIWKYTKDKEWKHFFSQNFGTTSKFQSPDKWQEVSSSLKSHRYFSPPQQKVVARRNLVLGDLCTHPSGAHEIRELCKRKTSFTKEWKNFFQNFGTTSKFQSPEKWQEISSSLKSHRYFSPPQQKVVARRNLVLGDLCTHPSGAHEIRASCKRKTLVQYFA